MSSVQGMGIRHCNSLLHLLAPCLHGYWEGTPFEEVHPPFKPRPPQPMQLQSLSTATMKAASGICLGTNLRQEAASAGGGRGTLMQFRRVDLGERTALGYTGTT